MTAPVFVGVGPVTSSTSPTWPTSLTIGPGRQPAGISTGDRVFLVIAMFGPTGPSHNPVHHFAVTNPGWTPTTPGSSTQALGAPTRVGVHVFTARWAPSLLPVTVTPRDFAGAVVDSDVGPVGQRWWKCYLAAWSPSAAVSGGQARYSSGGSFLPRTSAPWGVGPFAHAGTAVMFGHTSSEVVGSGTLNGFTPRAVLGDAPQWIPGRTDLVIADKPVAAGATTPGPHFDAVIGVQGGALLFALDTPDPPIAGGWRLGLGF